MSSSLGTRGADVVARVISILDASMALDAVEEKAAAGVELAEERPKGIRGFDRAASDAAKRDSIRGVHVRLRLIRGEAP